MWLLEVVTWEVVCYPLRKAHCILNGQFHVWQAHLRFDAAISKLNHAVNNALRMDDNLYLIGMKVERSGIPTKLDLPNDFERLPRDIETALFRIVQESLSNIHRHSESKTAWIALSRHDDELRLIIRDEGTGMSAEILDSGAELGVGIAGMKERVRQLRGRLDIHSSERGTEVIAALPVGFDADALRPTPGPGSKPEYCLEERLAEQKMSRSKLRAPASKLVPD